MFKRATTNCGNVFFLVEIAVELTRFAKNDTVSVEKLLHTPPILKTRPSVICMSEGERKKKGCGKMITRARRNKNDREKSDGFNPFIVFRYSRSPFFIILTASCQSS